MSKSLLKAIDILDCFIENQEMTINSLIEKTNMSKTTVFRLANTLEEAGLLVKDKRSSHDVVYRLGMKFLSYGKHVRERLKYNKIALPYMEELNKEIDELVHFTVIEGYEAVYIETFYSSKPLRLVVKEGTRAPLFAGSAPKLLLTGFSDLELKKYLNEVEFEKITNNTINNIRELKKEIQKIKNKGFSISKSEIFSETVGFSFPIYDYEGKIVAALGVSVPEKDYSKNKEESILINLKESAINISEELGLPRNNYDI